MTALAQTCALQLSRFWFWHQLYWLGYLLLKYTHLGLLIPLQQESTFPYLATYTLITLINLSLTGWLGARELARPCTPAQQLQRLAYWLVPLLLLLIPLRQYLLTHYAMKSGPDFMTHWSHYLVAGIPLVLLPLCGWVAVFLLMKLNFFRLQQLEHRQQLLKQARQARLKVLRYQLNPHFMFNTLNALNSLIVSRKGLAAEDLIQQLSAFLRHSLKNQDDQWVPLREELQALQAYLAIQQVRFGERLVLDWQLEHSASLQLPPLLLQPIAEQAILQTVAEQSGSIHLHIGLTETDNTLQLTVCSGNAGTDVSPWPADQLPASLQQLQERLELLFGTKASLTLFNPVSGFYARLNLPVEVLHAADPARDRGR
jgi:hypothetical protein